MKFLKMHGLGNDFMILDLRNGDALPSKDKMAALTHRKIGIGCDQLIPVLPPQDPRADAFMRIINAPNATEAEACGNATRCVADMLMREKKTDTCVIQTVAGLLHCERTAGGFVSVDMGAPRLNWNEIPLSKECDTLHLPLAGDPVGVNIGNPHCVFFMEEDVERYPVREIGPGIETDALFPQKTNVEFCNVLDRKTIRMRVWERDTGETEACGSAACGTAVAAIRRGLVDRECRVILNGGALDFHWREQDGHIIMTGPVTYVYEGKLLV
jgi:diaminopimelate epimerase